NHGFRVVHPLDFMAAVAVEELGRVAVAQRGDAAVERVLVALELLVVAAAAIRGDSQLEGVARSVADRMRRVAIGADRRLGQHLPGVFLPVYRGLVGLELVRMAFAANGRDTQAPLRVFGGVPRR